MLEVIRHFRWRMLACFLGILGAAAVRLSEPEDPVHARWHRVRPGMTEREVEEIVGPPTIWMHTTEGRVSEWQDEGNLLVEPDLWQSRQVSFDGTGHAFAKTSWPPPWCERAWGDFRGIFLPARTPLKRSVGITIVVTGAECIRRKR